MPEFPLLEHAGIHRSAGVVTATSKGTVATAAASLHTKGAFVELIASTTIECGFLTVFINGGSVASNYLVDIALGPATERVIIANLLIAPSHAIQAGYAYQFPISIPAGTRISARCQQDKGAVSATIDVSLILSDPSISSFPAFQRVETFGAITTPTTEGTTLDPGATPNVKPATYTTLVAATAHAYRWLTLGFGRDAVTTTASRRWLLDIALGASSSERIIMADIQVDYEATADMPAPLTFALPVSIPAGSRISGRVAVSEASATSRLLQVIGYGVG